MAIEAAEFFYKAIVWRYGGVKQFVTVHPEFDQKEVYGLKNLKHQPRASFALALQQVLEFPHTPATGWGWGARFKP